MSDDNNVRQIDIDNLIKEDRILHERITRNSDQNREDNQRIIDKIDEIQKSINSMVAPIAEIATQVSNNTKDLELIKKTQKISDKLKGMIDVQTEKIRENTENRVKWDKRVWAIMIMMIAQLIGLAFAFFQGGN